MPVPYFDGLGLSRNLVRHFLALVDVGNGIVQGMLQEIDAVIAAELTLYGILVAVLRPLYGVEIKSPYIPYS